MSKPDADLIPRQVLFGNPEKDLPCLSPDGTKLSYTSPVNGVLNIWVGPTNNPSAARPVTHDIGSGIRTYVWAHTNEHLLYLQDKDGNENWQLSSVNVNTGHLVDLTTAEATHTEIIHTSPKFPDEAVVSINDRVLEYQDLYRINIRTGERSLIQRNDAFEYILTDDDFQARIAYKFTSGGGGELFQYDNKGNWHSFTKVNLIDSVTTRPIGFNGTGDILYMIDSRHRNTASVNAISLDKNEHKTVSWNSRADPDQIIQHPKDKNIQAVRFNYQHTEWEIIDQEIKHDMEFLNTLSRGEVSIVSRTLDDTLWIVSYSIDTGPIKYYTYHRKTQNTVFLFEDRPDLNDWSLAKMRSVIITARDGLKLICYYTLPPEYQDFEEPSEPLPLLLNVHGGPWSRDEWGYDPIHQWGANRGYAVLSVNFRGSTGFGKQFLNAGNLEWGGKMQDDLMEAVQWAIDKRIANPDFIAIRGASYGGYATLRGLTSTPNLFACGVDLVGPSNLISMTDKIPAYRKSSTEMEAKRIGDPRTEKGRSLLKDRSPLTHVNRIERPLLVGHGANDTRVNRTESDQIVDAIRRKRVPVTYLVYMDEGHKFSRPENRLSFNAITESFLAQHLGGRLEPIGGDLEGSSLVIVAGADHVHGLIETFSNNVEN